MPPNKMPFRIVYLDDEPDMCEMFKDNFASDELQVRTFIDVAGALKHVEAEGADLVFLDYRLPNTTGDVVAKKLPPEIPKVLLSGDLTLNTTSAFVRVFSKPFDFDEMTLLIETFVKMRDAA